MHRGVWRKSSELIMGLLMLLACPLGVSGEAVGQPDEKTSESQDERFHQATVLFRKALEAPTLVEKEAIYVEALKLRLGYPEAHNNLGDVYEKQGRFREAIREYQLAAMLAPDFPYPYFGLGDIYLHTGDYKKAVESYQKGLQLKPDDAQSLVSLRIAHALNQEILFESNSCVLTDPMRERVREIAYVLSLPQMAGSTFEIQGHTDNTGPFEYNSELSRARADAVKHFLVDKYKLNPERFSVRGLGFAQPLAPNDTNEGRKLNRRVELHENSSSSQEKGTRGI